MVLQTVSQINIRQAASKTATIVCTAPANTDVEIVGAKIIWKDNIPFVKVSYGRHLCLENMILMQIVLRIIVFI